MILFWQIKPTRRRVRGLQLGLVLVVDVGQRGLPVGPAPEGGGPGQHHDLRIGRIRTQENRIHKNEHRSGCNKVNKHM